MPTVPTSPNSLESLEALIFDFDGLILDTETPEFVAWSEIYAAHGVTLPRELWVNAIGRGHEQEAFDPYAILESAVGHSVDRDAIRLQRRARYLSLIAEEPIRPGIETYLREAKKRGWKLAVASSSERAWVEGHLRERGLLPFFDLTCCADDVARTKPDPALYLAALAGLGVSAERTVAFEDSPNGVRAAKAAGLYCIAVPNPMTADLPLDHADRVVKSLAEFTLSDLLAMSRDFSPSLNGFANRPLDGDSL